MDFPISRVSGCPLPVPTPSQRLVDVIKNAQSDAARTDRTRLSEALIASVSQLNLWQIEQQMHPHTHTHTQNENVLTERSIKDKESIKFILKRGRHGPEPETTTRVSEDGPT